MKVRALKSCEEMHVFIKEAGHEPKAGEIFEVKDESRIKALTGYNQFNRAFVEVIDKPEKKIEVDKVDDNQPDDVVIGPIVKKPSKRKPKTKTKDN